jgi:AcrR family transcriptional regulator
MNLTIPVGLAPDRSSADARAADILNRARQAFVEKGFDGASMQDLARAAGMSVGNFYRYFPSKAAIVAALVLADVDGMDRDFGAIISSPDPMGNLRSVIRIHVEEHECREDGLLWAEITAAALRKPEIAAIIQGMEQRVLGYLCAVFAQASGLSMTDAEARFTPQALFLIAMVKAAGMLARGNDPTTVSVRNLILKTIDTTLSEIALSTKA